jgi:hypothetical protein
MKMDVYVHIVPSNYKKFLENLPLKTTFLRKEGTYNVYLRIRNDCPKCSNVS